MKQIFNIAYYEIRHIFKDPLLFIIVFIAPLAYASLFGIVYVSAILSDVPLAIVNQDNSALSREIAEAFNNSPYFEIVEAISSYEQLEIAMETGTVRAGVIIPENFARDVYEHRKTQVLAVYDGSNLIWGLNIRKNALEVINDFNVRYTAAYLAGMGLTETEMSNTMNTVDCNIRTWYNPTFSYVTYLFVGIMMMAVHQLGLLSTALTVSREKEQNSWIQYLLAAIPGWKIMLGKCLPYIVSTFFNYLLLLWMSSNFVHAKVEADLFSLVIMGVFYVLTIVFSGFVISLYFSNSLQITRYIMLLSVPFVMLSGYTWPSRFMPDLLNSIAIILPSTWMMAGIRMTGVKGLGIEYIWLNILVLAIMAVLALGLALSLKKDRKAPEDPGVLVNCASSYPRKL